MLCDKCQKNEATVHIKEFHGGKCITHHLCAGCAAEQENQGELGALGFNLAEVLFNVGKIAESFKDQSEKKEHSAESASVQENGRVCPFCGWDAGKIREANGKVGCPECYDTFSDILTDAFSKVQRGATHTGKRPDPGSGSGVDAMKAELVKLQKELSAAISREEYENAAVLRDRINSLKNAIEQVKE